MDRRSSLTTVDLNPAVVDRFTQDAIEITGRVPGGDTVSVRWDLAFVDNDRGDRSNRFGSVATRSATSPQAPTARCSSSSRTEGILRRIRCAHSPRSARISPTGWPHAAAIDDL
jgi:hypothetical protein